MPDDTDPADRQPIEPGDDDGMNEIPEEMKEFINAIQNQANKEHDLFHMNVEDAKHEWYRAIGTLKEDQLAAVLRLATGISSSGEGAAEQAAYYQGIFTMMMESRFGICPSCHKNHDKEMNALKDEPMGSVGEQKGDDPDA